MWGTRTNTADSLQNIKHGSERAEFDPRVEVDRERDVVIHKRMPSPFWVLKSTRTNAYSSGCQTRASSVPAQPVGSQGFMLTSAMYGTPRRRSVS